MDSRYPLPVSPSQPYSLACRDKIPEGSFWSTVHRMAVMQFPLKIKGKCYDWLVMSVLNTHYRKRERERQEMNEWEHERDRIVAEMWKGERNGKNFSWMLRISTNSGIPPVIWNLHFIRILLNLKVPCLNILLVQTTTF